MDPAALNFLATNLAKLDKVTQAQRDGIAAALEAYDFGTDAFGAEWRDDMVARLKKGGFNTEVLATQYAAGMVTLKACP